MRTAICWLSLAGLLAADDWPSFRGPAGLGTSAESKAPLSWSPAKNVKWRTELPQPAGGSPVVSAGRVFVAGAEDKEGRRRALWCFDRKDGKLLWTRVAEYAKPDPTHQTNPYGGGTPAADGRRVVVWHSSAGLHCYDLEGKELWKRDLGEFRHLWGYGTSPVLHGGKVYLNTGPGRKSFLLALDLESGKTLWQIEEPHRGDGERNENQQYMGSWSTPLILKSGGREVVVCVQPTRVVAYEPADGAIVWWCDGVRHEKGDLAYSSPSLAGDLLVAYGGFGGPGLAVRLGGKGDVTATHRVWRNEKNPQSIGSGVVVDGALFLPFEPALACIDPKTGKVLWRERGAGNTWGSVVLAAGRAYVTSQNGTTTVFKPSSAKFEPLSTNELGEHCNATPAVSDGELFIRTFKSLWCIAE